MSNRPMFFADAIGLVLAVFLAAAALGQGTYQAQVRGVVSDQTGAVVGNAAVTITENVFEYLDGPIVRVTAPDTPVPYSPPLEEAFLPNVEKVVEKARWLYRY